jgi:DNA (cytosine-5)-methyltransferase 1
MAGFEVHGVDLKHGKRYPYMYTRADVLEVLRNENFIDQFDVIHASPPCQTHSITKHLRNAQGKSTSKLDLIPQTREALVASGKPYIIENVVGSPLINPVRLCGSSFGLRVRRHRLFESNMPIKGSVCDHKIQGRPVGVYGAMGDQPQGRNKVTGTYVYGGQVAKTVKEAQNAMGIDWAIWSELVEAIPPAYTQYLGTQIKEYL